MSAAATVPDEGGATLARRRLLLVALQLLLVLLVVRLFAIEERRGLFSVLCLASVGFLILRGLPPAWRPAFFLAVSLASFPLLLGWNAAAWVIGLGLLLIGIAHLPLPFWARVGMLLACGAGLFWWRTEDASLFWPVLGSIFMFRLWIYLRERRRDPKPAPWPQRLAYFFLLPNAAFPFFPIVGWRTFRDTCSSDPTGLVAQQGVSWIVRGILHLLLYRAVKLYLLPTPLDLVDAEYVALFLVANYALYLRISGHFHIITGLLHLYGYDLPRTHDNYFLASSFTDIWRRINIYWKDFLAEHVFFPAFFALRRLPRAAAIVISVAATFAATWLLHSWQAFWLLGDFPIARADAALWLSAGTFVAVNSLLEYRAAARRIGPPPALTVGRALRRSVQVAGTFLAVSFFWACWTVSGFPQLIAAIAGSGGFRTEAIALPIGVPLAAVAVGTAVQLVLDRFRRRSLAPAFSLEWSPAACIMLAATLAMIGLPQVHGVLGHRVSRAVAVLQQDPTSMAEAGRIAEGYYENLAEANLQADALTGAGDAPRPRAAIYFDAVRDHPSVLEKELIPAWEGEADGFHLRINRWGMRDDDVPRRKAPGVYRIAVLGSSITMGYGVEEDADFESLLERRINSAAPPGGPRVELLNFATGGYYALHSAEVLRERALRFEPDAVYYFAHQGEFYGVPPHLTKVYRSGYPLPYACLYDVIEQAGVADETSWGATGIALRREAKSIVRCVYRGIVQDCRARGVVPVWIYIPLPAGHEIPGADAEILAAARDAGFVVIDLSDWPGGRSAEEIRLGAADYHISAAAHRLIAERLFEKLQQQPETLPPPHLRAQGAD